MDINTLNNMEEIKNLQEKFQGMTPEDQQSLLTNLYMQNMQMSNRLRQFENQTLFKKMDYLFKVIDLGVFKDDFTKKCEAEIEAIMFGIPENDKDIEADSAEK